MGNNFSERARQQRAIFESGEKAQQLKQITEREKAAQNQARLQQRYSLRPHLTRLMRQNAIEIAAQLPARTADRVVKKVRVIDVPHPEPRWSLRSQPKDKNTYKWVGLDSAIWLVDTFLIGSRTWQETSHCGSGSSSTFRGIVISQGGDLRTFDRVFEQQTTNPYKYTNVFDQMRTRLRSPYIARSETFESVATDEDLIPLSGQPQNTSYDDLIGPQPAVLDRWQGKLLGLLDTARYEGLPKPEDIGSLPYMSLAEAIGVGEAQTKARNNRF